MEWIVLEVKLSAFVLQIEPTEHYTQEQLCAILERSCQPYSCSTKDEGHGLSEKLGSSRRSQ